MKRAIIILALGLLYGGLALAQPRINEIRAAYSKALDMVKEFGEEGTSTGISRTQIASQENLPGSGPNSHTVDCYYTTAYDPELDAITYTLYFIRVKRLYAGVRPELHEFLVDPKTGELMFVYNNLTPIEGPKVEYRLYFDTQRNLIRYLNSNNAKAKVDATARQMANDKRALWKDYVDMLRAALRAKQGKKARFQGE